MIVVDLKPLRQTIKSVVVTVLFIFFILYAAYLFSGEYVYETIEIESYFRLTHPLKINIKLPSSDNTTGDGRTNAFTAICLCKINSCDCPTEVLLHLDFMDRSADTRGFIQVWTLHEPAPSFLTTLKDTHTKEYTGFTSTDLKAGIYDATEWNYTKRLQTGEVIRGIEVFFSDSGRLYRISLFYPEHGGIYGRNKEMLYKMLDSFEAVPEGDNSANL
jgi:hypothetical protein